MYFFFCTNTSITTPEVVAFTEMEKEICIIPAFISKQQDIYTEIIQETFFVLQLSQLKSQYLNFLSLPFTSYEQDIVLLF